MPRAALAESGTSIIRPFIGGAAAITPTLPTIASNWISNVAARGRRELEDMIRRYAGKGYGAVN
jgi:hypothetical protein